MKKKDYWEVNYTGSQNYNDSGSYSIKTFDGKTHGHFSSFTDAMTICRLHNQSFMED